jgi:rhamnosyltransferase
MVQDHVLIIPLFGTCPGGLAQRLHAFLQTGLGVVLIQNDPRLDVPSWPESLDGLKTDPRIHCLVNRNRGGVAGGFNRGIAWAVDAGATWITLLDQDSDLRAEDLLRLREPWQVCRDQRLMVGPVIWDGRRQQRHGRRPVEVMEGFWRTRLLISSGTTFRAVDWQQIGPMNEWLVVDFVDHAWSFQAQERGFLLVQHPDVQLLQCFGKLHPNGLCRAFGMELYSPMRHYYSLRNLRWLLRQESVPLDLRLKELVKMLFKPWLWLFFEPKRSENLVSISRALFARLQK